MGSAATRGGFWNDLAGALAGLAILSGVLIAGPVFAQTASASLASSEQRGAVGAGTLVAQASTDAQTPPTAQPQSSAQPDPAAAPPQPAAAPADPAPTSAPATESAAPASGTGGSSVSAHATETSIRVAPVACGHWVAPGLPEGPVSLGFNEADVATGRRVCPRTEVSLAARASATIATADFYGSIAESTLLSASWAQTEKRELFLTFEAFNYGWTVNAVIESTDIGFGQLTAGASQIVASGDTWATATSARLMLPTSMLSDVRVVGAEVGQALTFRPIDVVELHAYAGVDGSTAIAAAPFPRAGVLVNVGAQWSPFSRFGFVLDANARYGGITTYVAPAVALRFRVANAAGLEIAATKPVAGTDRRTAIVAARFSMRF